MQMLLMINLMAALAAAIVAYSPPACRALSAWLAARARYVEALGRERRRLREEASRFGAGVLASLEGESHG